MNKRNDRGLLTGALAGLLMGALILVTGCTTDETAYERGVADYEPIYCYRTLADPDCYRRPLYADDRRLVNFYGESPRRICAEAETEAAADVNDGAGEARWSALATPPTEDAGISLSGITRTALKVVFGAAGATIGGPAGAVTAAGGGGLATVLVQDEDASSGKGQAKNGRQPIRLDPPPPAAEIPGGREGGGQGGSP